MSLTETRAVLLTIRTVSRGEDVGPQALNVYPTGNTGPALGNRSSSSSPEKYLLRLPKSAISSRLHANQTTFWLHDFPWSFFLLENNSLLMLIWKYKLHFSLFSKIDTLVNPCKMDPFERIIQPSFWFCRQWITPGMVPFGGNQLASPGNNLTS